MRNAVLYHQSIRVVLAGGGQSGITRADGAEHRATGSTWAGSMYVSRGERSGEGRTT